MNRKQTYLLIAIGVLVLMICAVPVLIYRHEFNLPEGSTETSDWGTFGDYLGGVLNPFIGFLTLVATAAIALLLYNYESKRDKKSQSDADVKLFMELYQFFISADFREVRVMAWHMFKIAISNNAYKDFLVGENYVSRYNDRKSRTNVYAEFKDLFYQSDYPTSFRPQDKHAFLRQEAIDRNKVDTLVNFFQWLALKEINEEYYKVCDFYYDTWRPVLYWYATELKSAYDALGVNQKYHNEPNLLTALKRLDSNYYKSTRLSIIDKEDFMLHPIILHMKSYKPGADD